MLRFFKNNAERNILINVPDDVIESVKVFEGKVKAKFDGFNLSKKERHINVLTSIGVSFLIGLLVVNFPGLTPDEISPKSVFMYFGDLMQGNDVSIHSWFKEGYSFNNIAFYFYSFVLLLSIVISSIFSVFLCSFLSVLKKRRYLSLVEEEKELFNGMRVWRITSQQYITITGGYCRLGYKTLMKVEDALILSKTNKNND